MATTNEQEQIKTWFERTYSSRSKLYLRPPQAYEVFMSLLQPMATHRLLDVACGPGRLLEVAQKYDLDLHGIDLSENAIKMARETLPAARLHNGNAEALPYPAQHFDYLTCIGSLERFLNLEQALAEQYRVGKPQARYCFMVRNSNTLGWKVIKKGLGFKNKKGHQGAKNLQEWTTVFKQAGFNVERVVADQWPRQRLLRFFNPGLDFKKIKTSVLPIEYANEFIFLLNKPS